MAPDAGLGATGSGSVTRLTWITTLGPRPTFVLDGVVRLFTRGNLARCLVPCAP